MAKISVEFDTNTKALAVSIDGASVQNVCGIDIFPSYDDPDEYRCSIMTCSEDETSEIQTMTRMMASESSPARSCASTEPAKHEGFVQVKEQPRLQAAISAFLRRA